jgi:hypothetical protein
MSEAVWGHHCFTLLQPHLLTRSTRRGRSGPGAHAEIGARVAPGVNGYKSERVDSIRMALRQAPWNREGNDKMQLWELYYPGASATGLYFARSRIEPTDVVWVHAAPESLAVIVRSEDGSVIAERGDLRRIGSRFPMTRLRVGGGTVEREDRFPQANDVGSVVLLPGGEAGRLASWWNAGDGTEWRWQVEFYNKIN